MECPKCGKEAVVPFREVPNTLGDKAKFVCPECFRQSIIQWHHYFERGKVPDDYHICVMCAGLGIMKGESDTFDEMREPEINFFNLEGDKIT